MSSSTDFAQRYRDMSPHRLAQLAANEDNLVPEAREAIRAEIARRSPQDVGLRPSTVEEPASAEDPLDGVGGWFSLYFLGLVGGFFRQIRLAFSLGAGSPVTLALSVVALGIAAWNLATGVGIVWRAPSTLKMIFIQLIISAIQAAVFLVAGVALFASYSDLTEEAGVLIGLALLSGTQCAIWFRYFQVSKRVKAVFGRNL